MLTDITNIPLFLAGVLSALTAAVHAFGGGREIVRPLLAATDIAPVPKLTAYYCWHIVTITLVAMSVTFIRAGIWGADVGDVTLWAAIAAAFTLWSIALFIWKRQSPLMLPQWALFLPITALAVWGLT